MPSRSASSGSAARDSLFILAAAVLWGTTGTAQALAPVGATPLAVGALRLAVGGGALVLIAGLRGTLRIGHWRHPSALLAAAGVAAYQASFFAGVARTGVAVGTLVAIGSAPIIAGILETIVARSRPTSRWWGATAAAIVGCALLLAGDGGWSADFGGVLLAIIAGASFAVYTVASKSLLRTLSPDAAIATTFFAGALVLSPVLLTTDLTWALDPRGLAVALHLGLVATAAAYVLYVRGLTGVTAATASTLTLAEPLTAGLLSVAVLGERLAPLAYAGAALVFVALAVLSIPASGGRRSTRSASRTHGKSTRPCPPAGR